MADEESDGVATDGSEDESTEPTSKYEVKVPGYDDTGFEKETELPPPTDKKDLSQYERPPMPFAEIGNISEEECRDALFRHVAEHCCWGSKAGKEMVFSAIKYSTAFHYTLETYAESRTTSYQTKPYRGEHVDGPDCGTAPGPWEMGCSYSQVFKNQTVLMEVPHTSVVKDCQRCGASGKIRCGSCRGRGNKRCHMCRGRGRRRVRNPEGGYDMRRCHFCGGDGRKRCLRCHGMGRITCPKCQGYCQLRVYVQLCVKYVNHKSEYIKEDTAMPDHLVKSAGGETAFSQTLDLVWPLTDYPIPQINENSQRLINDHQHAYARERVHKQRQLLRAIAVTEVEWSWDTDRSQFWVYGNERSVHAPTYPQQCCWGCDIL